jgi:hypothetical protein
MEHVKDISVSPRMFVQGCAQTFSNNNTSLREILA